MKTIYIDHNILIYLVESNNDEHRFLQKILMLENVTFVFSLWSLVEIINCNRSGQSIKLAQFVDKLQPKWILERLNIQEVEIEKFVFRDYFKSNSVKSSPIKKHLSEVLCYLDSSDISIGVSAEKFVTEWLSYPSIISGINKEKENTLNTLNTLQTSKKHGKYTSEVNDKVRRMRYKDLLPRLSPDSLVITPAKKESIVEHLMTRKKSFYKSSPCWFAEEKIVDFRVSNPARKPEKQDAIDLQHAVPSLAYCDYFVTNDGYLKSAADYVKKHCSLKQLTICRSLNQVYNDIENCITKQP